MLMKTVTVLVYVQIILFYLVPFYYVHIGTDRKRRGAAGAVYVKASSSIARHVLQQLESVKVLEQDDDNG